MTRHALVLHVEFSLLHAPGHYRFRVSTLRALFNSNYRVVVDDAVPLGYVCVDELTLTVHTCREHARLAEGWFEAWRTREFSP